MRPFGAYELPTVLRIPSISSSLRALLGRHRPQRHRDRLPAMEDGMDPGAVLGHLAELRQSTARADRTSPETEDQRAFVSGWR